MSSSGDRAPVDVQALERVKNEVYERLGEWKKGADVPLVCIHAYREAQMRKQRVELWCICRQPYDDKRFYIQCGFCKGWFHGECVGVSSVEAEKYTKWCCTRCYELGQGESQLKGRAGAATRQKKDRKVDPEKSTLDEYDEKYDPDADAEPKLCALCLKPGLDWCDPNDAANKDIDVPVEGRFLGPKPFLMPKKTKAKTKEDELYEDWEDSTNASSKSRET